MATLPYIQLYVSDYLADTQHLTTEEHGAYLLLIMNYWQTEKPIPQNRLQGITRVFNDRWEFVKQNLNEFFAEDENGSWYHERIHQDLEKVKSKSKQASEAGKKSAEMRAKKKAQNKGLSNCSSTTVEQKPSNRPTIKEKREKIKEDDVAPLKSYEDALFISEYLLEKIYDVNPTFKQPKIETWAVEVEKAIRIDKRTKEQYIEIIDWIYSTQGKFWQRNILSGNKLREKFDQLNMEMIAKPIKDEKKYTYFADGSRVEGIMV